jgi:hypothetical protein
MPSRVKEVLHQKSAQMEKYFEEIQKELAFYKGKAALVELLQEQLAVCEARNKELHRSEFVNFVLEDRISYLDKKIQDILLAPDHEGRALFPPDTLTS